MKSEAINNILSFIETTKELNPESLGTRNSKITKGIFKYIPNERSVSQITAFYENYKLFELGFLTSPEPLTLSELTNRYGEPKLFYSFRDNLTRFEYYFKNNNILEKIYCDIDNEWSYENSILKEKKSTITLEHSDINLDGFCIKLK
ncbi:MAG: hypothetical protein ACRBBR_00605 [Cellvibrionaceae bacterium]